MINQAKQGYQKHVRSYQKIGNGTQHHAYVVESIRADIASKYYDTAYGDGSDGSFERDNSDFYGR